MMKEEDKEYVIITIENEGFDYAFNDYSDFKEIRDDEFHRLRRKYLEARKKLEKYLQID